MKITDGTVHVFTYKDGVLSRLGHDIRLSLSGFEVEVDGERVDGRFRTTGMVVDGAIRGGRLDADTFSAKDLRDIRDNIDDKVLHTRRHPEARYTGTVRDDGDRVVVRGTLHLVGRSRAVEVVARREGGRLKGKVELTPTRWGIKPFKALLGSIRIQDRVDVQIDLPDPFGEQA